MKLSDLDFQYPERLIATERVASSRVMLVEGGQPRELQSISELTALFEPGDCLVVNDSRVLKRRVFSTSGLEILFLQPRRSVRCSTRSVSSSSVPPVVDQSVVETVEWDEWEVLCPSSRWKMGTEQILPGGVRLELLERGRPQIVRADRLLFESYFESHGEMPLPPYIQKARHERRNRASDIVWYQTAWADKDGSLAAPTASLHFDRTDLDQLRARGVEIVEVTLHVGLGTFLSITVDDLDRHVMHAEIAAIPASTWSMIQATKARNRRVWALGTTVARTLEAAAHGQLQLMETEAGGGFRGATDLFIRPGFEFRVVDRLMTNFHQPKSTLLALVAAFSGLENVKRCYNWAMEREFRLFSYGDLTVWMK